MSAASSVVASLAGQPRKYASIKSMVFLVVITLILSLKQINWCDCGAIIVYVIVASSPGLLIGGRGKEGLVSTACACAVIIQILNNPITYGYRLYTFTDTFTVKYTENVVHAHAVDTRPSPPSPQSEGLGTRLMLLSVLPKTRILS